MAAAAHGSQCCNVLSNFGEAERCIIAWIEYLHDICEGCLSFVEHSGKLSQRAFGTGKTIL